MTPAKASNFSTLQLFHPSTVMTRYDYFRSFPEYVPVAERRARAQRAAKNLAANGRAMRPVVLEGRTIARSFWGKAWCDNVENYRDFAYRLERGRSYVRSGAVIDLVIEPGLVKALVQGSMRRPYEQTIRIDPLAKARWEALKRKALGKVSSLLDLAAGRVPEELLRAFCAPRDGLFPARGEISFSCSCPDSARLCKHLAAVFYGVGARLDEDPTLFFTLRGIDPGELLSTAGAVDALTASAGDAPEIDAAALGDVFGVSFDEPAAVESPKSKVESPKSKVESRKSKVNSLKSQIDPPKPKAARRKAKSGTAEADQEPWTAVRVSVLRRTLGLTQKAFGERLGLSNVAVCYIETGRKPVPSELAPALERLNAQSLSRR